VAKHKTFFEKESFTKKGGPDGTDFRVLTALKVQTQVWLSAEV
jgi:hypothetical protein